MNAIHHINSRSSRPLRLLTSLLAVSLLASPSLFAAVKTWNGAGADDYWSDGANWGGTAPELTGDDLRFAGSTRLTPANDLTGASFGFLVFNSGAGAFTLSGNSITLTGNITNSSTSLQTINLDLILNVATETINTASGDIIIGGNISETGGTRALTKSGTGSLTLSGANTYTGTTTVSGGTLTLSGGSAIADTGAVAVSGGASTLNVATSETVGAVTLTTGTITGAGKLTGSSYTVNNTSGTATISATLAGGGALTKTVGGGTLILSAANEYTGGTTLSGYSRLILNNDSALGTGMFNFTNGTLDNTSGGLITIGNNVTLGGTGFTFDADGDNNLTLTGAVDLGSGSRTITTSGTALLTLAGVVSNGTLGKAGAGTLILSAANTHTGQTISGGTLKLANQNALGSASLTLNNGGTLVFAASGTEYTIGGSIQAGGLDTSIILTNEADEAVTLTLNGGSAYQGSVSGKGGMVFAGSPTFYGDLSYEGTSWIQNGTLTLSTTTGVAGITLPNGKFILGSDVGNGILTITRDGSSFAAGGIELLGTTSRINNNGTNGVLKITGNITNTSAGAATLTMDANNAVSVTEIAGVISDGSGGATAITKSGNNTLILSGTNTYSGNSTLGGGTLVLNNNSALGTGTLIVQGNTTLGNTSGGLITLGNNVTINGNFTFVGTNDLTFTGDASSVTSGNARSITVNGPGTLTLAGATNTYNGGINSDIVALTKAGTGTLRLLGTTTVAKRTNGVAAVVVSDGTLLVDGTLTAAMSGVGRRVEVNSGATLGGTDGTIDMSVSVLSGGTVAPGGGDIGTLNVTGTATFAANSTFALGINATALTSDLLNVTGDISLATDDSTVLALNVFNDTPIAEGTTFTLLTHTGTWNGGLFTYGGNVLNEGAIFTYGANSYAISYGVEIANAFTLEAVPEPGTAALVFLGAGALAFWNLRRKARRANA